MPISNFFIVRILNGIRKETEYDEDDIDMMRYSLQAILWEVEKTIYLLLIFLALNYHWHFIVSFWAVMTIRPSAGGFHASTAWRCFFWTLFGFLLAFFVLPLIPLNNLTLILVGAYSVVNTYIATPVRSAQKERIADKSKDGQKKIKATIITIVWLIILFFNQSNFLAPAVLWIIFLQNFQLSIEYVRMKFNIR